ncbi:glucose-6-phosphate dehydrogenase [Cellulomonas fimi]|uniref:Glucose-6-phosphate 1-dehydrogenase n=1 Tax=Cellulomonas fimi TaxID=1708 RepID=A0A7Y0M0I0_CELFI|nr:glucose-6-phosphate dehydrogenase [Cellulomonas fimi]NMR21505.1 glucose-6-phosphate dehydrogenase [Cellulomonas fimi]
MSATIIVLGATGDLTRRYLLPGIAQLVAGGQLGDDVLLVGVAQDDLDDTSFRAQVAERLEQTAGQVDAGVREAVAAGSRYVRGDVTSTETLAAALAVPATVDRHDAEEPVVLYLALPHVLFEPVVEALAGCALPPQLRVVVEKPFGEDLAGAKSLNAALARVLREEQVFRVDHFLAKQTVLNLLGLRFANRVFEPLWTSREVAAIDIVFDETVDAQERAAYYDRSGALRDMVQNHLLQMLTLIAMEEPASLDPADLSARKVEVLRAVPTMSRAEVDARTVRGRYTAGSVTGRDGSRDVAAYTDAPGVEAGRDTETHAEVVLHVETPRWHGVPFRLRTGKALERDRREVVVHFRPMPGSVFDDAAPNELRLELDPDKMFLRINVNGIGDPFDLETVELDLELPRQVPTPYGQLILAILEGDTRLSARAEEAEEAWRIVEPILAAWADGASPLREYAAGSDGPAGDDVGSDSVGASEGGDEPPEQPDETRQA